MGDLSAHFSRSEFMCQCGSCDSLGDVNPELIQVLERLRAMCLGKPIKINSGHRCVTYNGKVGGSPNSQHILGNAADIVIKGVHPFEVHSLLNMMYPTSYGLGRYENFTHIDVRDKKARWDGVDVRN